MKSPADLGLPFDDWRPGQRLALRTILAAETPHVLVQAPTGCVVGTTEIRINRASIGYRVCIGDEYANRDHFNRKPRLVTYVRALKGKRIGLHATQAIVASGEKQTYLLRTQGGPILHATADHPILTLDQTFVALGDLTDRDEIVVEDLQRRKWTRHPKDQYRMVQGLRYHPFASRFFSNSIKQRCLGPEGILYRVPVHRLVAEARENEMSLAMLIDICRRSPTHAAHLTYLDPTVWAVHHIDEDSFNNDLDNLQVMTHEEHARHHGDAAHFRDGNTRTWKVRGVTRQSIEPTFDIICRDPYRNFLANGIVVHNSGKSTIAAALPMLDEHRRWLTLTATNGLLAQYRDTFPWLFPIKGMRHYPCRAAKDEFAHLFPFRRGRIMCDDGPCHAGYGCTLKERGCEYFDDVRTAIAHRTPITNYAYHLAMRRYAKGLGASSGLVCDEAHALPEQLMSACKIEIPKSILDARPPKTIAQWRAWASSKIESLTPGEDDDQRMRRHRLLDSLKALASTDHTWAWDEEADTIRFEPTIPRNLLRLLHTFDDLSTVVYLSATVSLRMLVDIMGVDERDVTVHLMPSRFPVDRCPIYCVPGAWMNYRMSWDKRADAYTSMDDIISRRLDRRGIIHSVSYSRQREIQLASRYADRMICPQNTRELIRDLRRFRETDGAILVSPAVMTGYDFPGRDCEYQILPKVPHPDTRSRIMKARIRATPSYREHYVMQQTEQACGRGMRRPNDQCETFITDETIGRLLQSHADLASQSFRDRVIFTRRIPRPLPRLAA